MEKKLRFYRCEECGHMAVSVDATEHPLTCCGEKLKEVTAAEHDGAVEKHLPVVERGQGEIKVQVGSVIHPMTEEHHIEFIVLETDCGFTLRRLPWDGEPIVHFPVGLMERPIYAYEYCNLHGLWRTAIE